jgi:hypothetical protein
MPHATPHRRRNRAGPGWDAFADPGREASPEELFAALLDGLDARYARDGIRGVIRIVLAAGAMTPPVRARGTRAAAPAAQLPEDPRSDDEVYRRLVATLEEAFLRDGLDGVADALSTIGREIVHGPDPDGPRRPLSFS